MLADQKHQSHIHTGQFLTSDSQIWTTNCQLIRLYVKFNSVR